MKWYVIPSLLACGLNCTIGTVVLGLAVFHLYTDKSTNAPIPPNEEWIGRMTGLIPFSAIWIGVSLLGIFVSMARNRIWLASSTLLLLVSCFGVSVYYACAFGGLLEMEDASADSLMTITQKLIDDQKDAKNWIPGWLDNVQKQSKQCCGIITYRDYEKFWSESPTKLPLSCCRDEKDIPSPCPGDLTRIPYPYTPAVFYKVDTGCMDDINESIRLHIQETFQNCIIMSVFIGIGVLAFILLYVKRYLVQNSRAEVKVKMGKPVCDCIAKGDGGVGDGNQGPLQINSDANPPLPPTIDSYDGGWGSVDSVAASSTAILDTVPPKDFKDTTPYPVYISPPQKTNALFAGLQNQRQPQPEAGTGDDTMTISAGNMGKHEIFVAQDIPLADTPIGRVVLQPTNSVDDVGDVVHEDDGNQEPGSPGGKRKKVRKLGVGHHHKKHYHNKEQ